MITLNDKEDKGKTEYLDKIAKEFENIKNPIIRQKEIKVDEIEDLNISEITQNVIIMCMKSAIKSICYEFREVIKDCQFTIKNGTYYINEDDLKEKIYMIEKGEKDERI